MPRRTSKREFSKRAAKVHGSRYDYSQVEFHTVSDRVTIGCATHGPFQQAVRTHLAGSGCSKCAAIKEAARRRFDLQEFERRARRVHADRYRYSTANYVDSTTPLTIICLEHGAFQQRPVNHLRGKGCPRCAVDRRRAPRGAQGRLKAEKLSDVQARFIERCRARHGDKYDYSQTLYRGTKHKITVICPIHGAFDTFAGNHARRTGCGKCRQAETRRKKLADDVLERLIQRFGESCDFSGSIYVAHDTPVRVVCHTHGPFERSPFAMLRGRGSACKQCTIEAEAAKRRRRPHGPENLNSCVTTTEDFIAAATLLHGALYDYSLVRFVNLSTRVTIGCAHHGLFEQFPNLHLSGSGCPRCAGNVRYSAEEFLAQAKARHGSRYTYDMASYISANQPVRVYCSTHGPFKQRGSDHLRGTGCPRCHSQGAQRRFAQPYTRSQFIELARQRRGNRYIYDKLPETIAQDAVISIECVRHGVFTQAARDHLRRTGCRHCANYRERALLGNKGNTGTGGARLSQAEFIQRVQDFHGDKYDFSESQYIGVRHLVRARCPSHGPFEQKGEAWLRGTGCPRCTLFGAYSLKTGLKELLHTNSSTAPLLTLYLTHQRHGDEAPFLNLGLAAHGYKARYGGRGHPYDCDPTPDRVTLRWGIAVLLEQVLLRETMDFHYTPKIAFAGGVRECRTASALALLEERLKFYLEDTNRLLTTKWVIQTAHRYDMYELLRSYLSKHGGAQLPPLRPRRRKLLQALETAGAQTERQAAA